MYLNINRHQCCDGCRIRWLLESIMILSLDYFLCPHEEDPTNPVELIRRDRITASGVRYVPSGVKAVNKKVSANKLKQQAVKASYEHERQKYAETSQSIPSYSCPNGELLEASTLGIWDKSFVEFSGISRSFYKNYPILVHKLMKIAGKWLRSSHSEKKVEPEASFEILTNPAWVVPAEEKFIKFLEESRYVPGEKLIKKEKNDFIVSVLYC
ncbi:hypothetical protein AAG906_006724 [Vitis piasezkii]